MPTSFLKVISCFPSLIPASLPVDRSRFSLGILQQLSFPFSWVFTGFVSKQQKSAVRDLPDSTSACVDISSSQSVVHILPQSLPQATLSFRFSNIQDTLVGTSLIFLLKLFRRIDFSLRAVLLFRETDCHSLRRKYPIDSWHLRDRMTIVTTEFL